ncbi:YihY/virulence factor BrkB family protein (plasmid) [Mesorhizobium sp. AR02]|uniref:YihY/virulence factor BrkB family protein n=1 Tax=Mesorhizobium sp. AR02 TaxID=2865837 RepID=UPI00215E6D8D|nr:YihY/virulence factor BrkB family protein [Mesorhizobium sp. AR02]UVK57319.1 YihY/virulence factor BrkB family protein [Mesorhizobium sp. AR02]
MSDRADHKRSGILGDQPSDLITARGWVAVWAVFRQALLRLWDDEALPLAGNIAFRMVLAMFPFLVFVSSLTAFIGDPSMANRLVEFLIQIIPAPLVNTLINEVRAVLTVRRGGVASVGVLLTIWFAIGGVDSVRVGLNRAYDIREHRSVLVIFLLEVVAVIGGALILVVVAYLLVVGSLVGSAAHRLLPTFQPGLFTLDLVRYPSAVAILAGALFAAHVFLPARRTRFSSLWPGVLFTVSVWMGLAGGFSLYLARFANYASYYAGLAGVIAALYFLYLSALVLIFGGEINRAIRIRRLARALTVSG